MYYKYEKVHKNKGDSYYSRTAPNASKNEGLQSRCFYSKDKAKKLIVTKY